MSKTKTFQANVSLTPQLFYILLSLATKPRHGYDILKQVKNDSDGKITLGPGTLYGAIKRMLEAELIVAVETAASRRKYYQLTEKGRSIFQQELDRYTTAIELAKKRKLLGKINLATFTLNYVTY